MAKTHETRPNRHLQSMIFVGAVLTFLGVAIAIIGLVGLQTSGTIGSQISTAQLTFTISGLLFGYGTLLLLVGWIFAAAKHQ